MWALATMGRGWFITLHGTGGAESEEIDGFSETDLHALEAQGYVTLVQKKHSYALSLTGKAYAEYKQMQEDSKLPEVLAEPREEAAPVTFDESQLQQIAATSEELLSDLRQNYDLSRSQASAWFRWTLIVSIAGFILLAIGVGLVLANQFTPGLTNSVAGIVSEFLALVFFRQATSANKRQDDYHRDLIDRQKTLDAVQLAQLITDESERDKIIEVIVKDLLGIESEVSPPILPKTAQPIKGTEQP
jgi:hypothetical protein